ncbi:ABC1 family-domain-containing protein [Globomyces pollinis-pini]|nr:ABC1 family-domain-containing protein [Globomyces pollinis-pini]
MSPKTTDVAGVALAVSRIFHHLTFKAPAVVYKTQNITKIKSVFEDSKDQIRQTDQHSIEMLPSKIPSTRIGRFYEYTRLGLGAGAIVGQMKRAVGLSDSTKSPLMTKENMDLLVNKLSKMRGAALKLGQMLSIQDLKDISPEIQVVMKRVQNRANYMPKGQLESVLKSEWGVDWQAKFQSFTFKPIAAASIGQVHQATFLDGTNVAIKIQYPGVADSIDSDLDNLVMLLSLGNFLPKGLYLENTINAARKELRQECDYLREANNMESFKQLIDISGLNHQFHVPKVYKELTTARILVTEFVSGVTIDNAIKLPQPKRNELGERLLNLCLLELFEFRLMQTDPNWSNFLYDSKNDIINLIDFGATRPFAKEFTDPYFKLLKAGAEKNRERAIEYSVQLGFLTGFESQTMLNAHCNSLFTLARPFSVSGIPFDFSQSTKMSEAVRNDIPVMLRERLKPPPEETYSLHRKLSGCFLLCGKLEAKIRCRDIFNVHYQKYKFE